MLSWGGAWLLLAHSPGPGWLPWAVALGVLVHITGDFLTCGGVPVPLVWLVAARAKVAFSPMQTGGFTEKVLLVPPFVVATLVLLWLNLPAAAVLAELTPPPVGVRQPLTDDPSARAASATAAATASATSRSSAEGTM